MINLIGLLVLSSMAHAADSSWNTADINTFLSPSQAGKASSPAILILAETTNGPAEQLLKVFNNDTDLVLRWQPGQPITEDIQGREIFVAGNSGDAEAAVRAMILKVMREGQKNPPLVINYLADHIYDQDGQIVNKQISYFHDVLAPRLIPRAALLAKGPSVKEAVCAAGEPCTIARYGSAQNIIEVSIDVVPLLALRNNLSQSEAKKKPLALPPDVTPLESAQKPGLFFGSGMDGREGLRATIMAQGKDLSYLDAQSVFRDDNLFNANPSVTAPNPGATDGLGQYIKVHYEQPGYNDYKSIEVGALGEDNSGSFKYYTTHDRTRQYSLFRLAYTDREHLGGFTNHFSPRVGYLKVDGIPAFGGGYIWPTYGEDQQVYSLRDTISYATQIRKLSLLSEFGGNVDVASRYGVTEWDNKSIFGGILASYPITDSVNVHLQGKQRVYGYNPDRYFELDQFGQRQLLLGLSHVGEKISAGIMGGIDQSRGTNPQDPLNNTQKQYMAWVKALDTTLTVMGVQGDFLKQATIAASRKVAGDWTAGITYTVEKYVQDFLPSQRRIGITVSYRPGPSPTNDMPDGREIQKVGKDDPYPQHAFVYDGRSPSLLAQTMAGNARLVNEFDGNLNWVMQDAASSPMDTISHRAGKCDSQAWANAWLLNRGQATGPGHIVDYWVGDLWSNPGHGITLETKSNGKTYMWDYGPRLRVDVDRNASLAKKMMTGLSQNGAYMALRPTNNQPIFAAAYGTNAPQTPNGYMNKNNQQTDWIYVPAFQTTSNGHPMTESGLHALLGMGAQ